MQQAYIEALKQSQLAAGFSEQALRELLARPGCFEIVSGRPAEDASHGAAEVSAPLRMVS